MISVCEIARNPNLRTTSKLKAAGITIGARRVRTNAASGPSLVTKEKPASVVATSLRAKSRGYEAVLSLNS